MQVACARRCGGVNLGRWEPLKRVNDALGGGWLLPKTRNLLLGAYTLFTLLNNINISWRNCLSQIESI